MASAREMPSRRHSASSAAIWSPGNSIIVRMTSSYHVIIEATSGPCTSAKWTYFNELSVLQRSMRTSFNSELRLPYGRVSAEPGLRLDREDELTGHEILQRDAGEVAVLAARQRGVTCADFVSRHEHLRAVVGADGRADVERV